MNTKLKKIVKYGALTGVAAVCIVKTVNAQTNDYSIGDTPVLAKLENVTESVKAFNEKTNNAPVVCLSSVVGVGVVAFGLSKVLGKVR